MDKPITIKVTPQEHATILAALRCWQAVLSGDKPAAADFEEIATDSGRWPPSGAHALDTLCERINTPKAPFVEIPGLRLRGRWSGSKPVPKVGAELYIAVDFQARGRDLGKVTVMGYDVEHGYLYLMCKPHDAKGLRLVGQCVYVAGSDLDYESGMEPD